MLCSKLIEIALKDLGVVRAGGTPKPNDAADALDHVNLLRSELAAQRLYLYTVSRRELTLVANQQDYTIGEDGTPSLDIPRPQWLASATVTPVGDDTELPLNIWTRKQWLDEPFKAMTNAYPQAIQLEPTFPNATLHAWPIPTTVAVVTLGLPDELTAALTLDTELAFPPGYDALWLRELEAKLTLPFGRPMPELVAVDLRRLRGIVQSNNDDGPPLLRGDRAITGGRGYYDIHSDTER